MSEPTRRPRGPLLRFWEDHALVWLTELCTRGADRFRRDVLPEASGRVLVLGAGTGPGLAFLDPAKVETVTAVEPHEAMWGRLRRRAEKAPFPVELVEAGGEELPFADASFDTATVELVLCTVGDPPAVLAELHRVLRPGGRLIYVEHVRHSDPRVSAFQDRLNPWWRRCAGGCRLNQETGRLIREAGFEIDRAEEIRDRFRPRFLSDVIWGVARRPA